MLGVNGVRIREAIDADAEQLAGLLTQLGYEGRPRRFTKDL